MAFARRVAMRYYAYRGMDMLERTFLDNGLDGYVALYKELYCKFMKACDTSEQFDDYLNYLDHVKWLDTILIIDTTTVIKGTLEVLYPKNWNEDYDKSKKQFLAKFYKVQVACQR